MRKAFFASVISLFFLFLLSQGVDRLSPWNLEEINQAITKYSIQTNADFERFLLQAQELGLIWNLLNYRNLLLLLLLAAGSIVGGVVSVHMFVEKLFFNKFYEEPSILLAVRRGLLVFFALLAMLLLKFIGGLFWYNAVAVIVIAVLSEYVFISFSRERAYKKQTKHDKKHDE